MSCPFTHTHTQWQGLSLSGGTRPWGRGGSVSLITELTLHHWLHHKPLTLMFCWMVRKAGLSPRCTSACPCVPASISMGGTFWYRTRRSLEFRLQDVLQAKMNDELRWKIQWKKFHNQYWVEFWKMFDQIRIKNLNTEPKRQLSYFSLDCITCILWDWSSLQQDCSLGFLTNID